MHKRPRRFVERRREEIVRRRVADVELDRIIETNQFDKIGLAEIAFFFGRFGTEGRAAKLGDGVPRLDLESFAVLAVNLASLKDDARRLNPRGAARRRNRRRPRLDEGLATQVEEPEDHALGYSRGGFSTKIHLICDSQGTVVGIHVTPGQRHDSKAFEPTLQRVYLRRRRGRRRWPRPLAGDKGYSYPRIWRWLSRRRIGRVIPTRKDQARDPNFDKDAYGKRNIIERVVGWAKESRRLLTRFEKLAVNYLAFWIIASLATLL